MTVSQPDVIDHVLRDSPEPGTWTLVAVEDRPLVDTQERVDQIITKLRTYREYLQSGQFLEQFSEARDAKVRLALVYYDGEVGGLLADSLGGIAAYLRDQESIDLVITRTERPEGMVPPGQPDESGQVRLEASTAEEAEYFEARNADDLTSSLLALFRITLELPVRGGRGKFLLVERPNGDFVVAYTTRTTLLTAARGSAADGVQSAPFIELLKMWEGIDYGLIINPGTTSELALPASTVPNILLLHETVADAEAKAEADARKVPEAPPARTVPIKPPASVGGFRFATVFDGTDDQGRPVLSEERGRVDAAEEVERLAGYLDGGELIMVASGFDPDALDPSRGAKVPGGMRTDGEWVWSDATTYYLRSHGIAPEPELRVRIVALDYAPPEVPEERIQAATEALKEQQRMAAQMTSWLDKRNQS